MFKLNKSIITLILLGGYFSSFAQVPTEQDCAGAIQICQSIYEQNNSYEGAGNIPNEVDPIGSCLTSGELNSVWYIFTVAEDGFFSFTLTPNDPQDDYDWAVYDITNNDCSELATNPSLLVSCNSYGLAAPLDNGPTGMSTTLGGIGDSNGPGDLGYVPFNQDLPVLQGETYVLMVEDWENPDNISTGTGYVLDFTNTTATIYDSEEPVIDSLFYGCDNQIHIIFSEELDCTTIDISDFSVENSDGDLFLPSSLLSDCSNQNPFINEILLTFDTPLGTIDSLFTLHILGSNGSVSDFCGNLAEINIDYDFTVQMNLQPNFTHVDSIFECPGTLWNDSLTLAPEGMNAENFDWNWNTGDTTTFIQIHVAGNYEYTISNDCYSQSGTIEVASLPIPDLNDQSVCDLGIQFSDPDLFTGSWTAVPSDGITFSNPTSNNSFVTADDYGSYYITFTSDDICATNSNAEVNFKDTPRFTIEGGEFCLERGFPELSPITDGWDDYTWAWEQDTILNPIREIEETGTYILFASNSCGSHSDTATVILTPCDLIIPNIFTPNLDQTIDNANNDTFQIVDITFFPGSTLKVFNRWGNLIYQSDDYKNDWAPAEDEVPDGNYYYILDQKLPDGTFENFNGYVTILR